MKVLSLFSGIGAFEKALKNINQPFELVGFSEIDKYAVKSYCAIHNVSETLNFGDITKIDEKALPKDIDLITYGFPCQDISLAGKQKGLFNDDGTQTRSGLFFEALRIIEETQPKIAIAENVKNLVGKKFNAQFQVVLASLEAAGYNNYWQVLNAKDYGIPQNRERVFIVSIRKDIDTGSFKFPEPFPLELRLKDVLESEVDEKFYLDGKFESITKVNENYSMLNGGIIRKMHDISRRVYNENATSPSIHTCAGGNLQPKVAVAMRGRYNEEGKVEQNIEVSDREIANALTTVQKDSMVAEPVILEDFYKNRDERIYEETAPSLRSERTGLKVVEPKIIKVGQIESSYDQSGRVYSPEGLSPTVMSNSHGGTTGGYNPPKIIVEPVALDEQNGYIRKDGCVGTLTTDGSSPKHNNRVIEPINPMPDGTCRTIKNQYYKTSKANFERSSTFGATGVTDKLRIRKLTPKECFRLMGFSDEDFAKAEAVNSNTQLYKQAGNSIVVDVIAHIFTSLKSEY